jgi:hypothetical protein
MGAQLELLESRLLLSDSPVITSLPSYTGNEGVYINIQNQAFSDDGPVTWSLANPPPHSVAHASGLFQWTPRDGQDGTYTLTWTVTDRFGNATVAVTTFVILNSPSVYYNIPPQNITWPPPPGVSPPVLADLPNMTVTAGRELTFDLKVTGGGSALEFYAFALPPGATFDAVLGRLTWTPTATGLYTDMQFFVRGGDGYGDSTRARISVVPNNAPAWDAIAPLHGMVGVPMQFTVQARDADGDPLTYACLDLPDGAAFDPVTRTFTWTPTQPGEFVVTFTASDGLATTQLDVTVVVHRLWAGGDSLTYIDRDGDGYGVGSPLGPDADDNDPDVNTFASALAKHGTVGALLNHLGYNPLRIFYIDPAYYNTHTYIASACAPADGGTDVNDPMAYFPFLSWDDVVGLGAGSLLPGDAVIFRAGTYGPDRRGNAITLRGQMGTEENPILVMGMPGELVTLTQAERGIYTLWDSTHESGWLRFDNFNIESIFGPAAISLSHASNITLQNIAISSAGLWGVSVQYDVRSIHMSNLVIRGQGEHGVYIGCTDDDVAVDISITGSLIYNCGDNGIHLNQRVDRVLIDANVLYGNTKALELDSGPRNVVVTNNLMFNNARSAIVLYEYDAVLRGRSDMSGGDMFNIVFAHNTIIGPTAVTISNEGTYASLDFTVRDVTFANNVIVTTQCVLAFVDRFGGSLAYRDRDGVVFEHNLIDVGPGVAMRLWNGTTTTLQFTMDQWQRVHGATVHNNLAATPQFRDATRHDYGLTPASPARELGANVDAMRISLSSESLQDLRNALRVDVLGLTRGTVLDAGAYRY